MFEEIAKTGVDERVFNDSGYRQQRKGSVQRSQCKGAHASRFFPRKRAAAENFNDRHEINENSAVYAARIVPQQGAEAETDRG